MPERCGGGQAPGVPRGCGGGKASSVLQARECPATGLLAGRRAGKWAGNGALNDARRAHGNLPLLPPLNDARMAHGNLPLHPPLPQIRGARLLAAGVRDASSLQELYLAWTGVGDEGASYLAQVQRGLRFGGRENSGGCSSACLGYTMILGPSYASPHHHHPRAPLIDARRWSATRASR